MPFKKNTKAVYSCIRSGIVHFDIDRCKTVPVVIVKFLRIHNIAVLHINIGYDPLKRRFNPFHISRFNGRKT